MENINRDETMPKNRPRSAAFDLRVTSNESIHAAITDTEEFENDEHEEPIYIAVKGEVSPAAIAKCSFWLSLASCLGKQCELDRPVSS